MAYKIKEVSDLAGISVRTLHYYDGIGLLSPESASPAGYRLYSDHDLEKLHQILFFRELGFSLKETANIMNNPAYDEKQALEAHRTMLLERRARLDELIKNVDNTINSMKGVTKMDRTEMFKAFDMEDIERHKREYAEEARQKYGHTDAYRESMKRTEKYTKEDWAKISERQNAIYKRIADSMEKGPSAPEVQKAVGDWRQLISDSFYDCTLEIFKGLGELYVSDERFTKNLDKVKPGFAEFTSQAIAIYCADARD